MTRPGDLVWLVALKFSFLPNFFVFLPIMQFLDLFLIFFSLLLSSEESSVEVMTRQGDHHFNSGLVGSIEMFHFFLNFLDFFLNCFGFLLLLESSVEVMTRPEGIIITTLVWLVALKCFISSLFFWISSKKRSGFLLSSEFYVEVMTRPEDDHHNPGPVHSCQHWKSFKF